MHPGAHWRPLSETEAYFSALPTDPTALEAELLTLGKQLADILILSDTPRGHCAISEQPSCCVAQRQRSPMMTNYQEASTLLWSALVQPHSVPRCIKYSPRSTESQLRRMLLTRPVNRRSPCLMLYGCE